MFSIAICGFHRKGLIKRWLIHRHGYYCPTIDADCYVYAKGREECQKHGPIQRITAEELHPIVNPWPFRG